MGGPEAPSAWCAPAQSQLCYVILLTIHVDPLFISPPQLASLSHFSSSCSRGIWGSCTSFQVATKTVQSSLRIWVPCTGHPEQAIRKFSLCLITFPWLWPMNVREELGVCWGVFILSRACSDVRNMQERASHSERTGRRTQGKVEAMCDPQSLASSDLLCLDMPCLPRFPLTLKIAPPAGNHRSLCHLNCNTPLSLNKLYTTNLCIFL